MRFTDPDGMKPTDWINWTAANGPAIPTTLLQ